MLNLRGTFYILFYLEKINTFYKNNLGTQHIFTILLSKIVMW